MQNVPPTTEDHVSERLPWEQLTIPPAQDRRFLIYGIAAGLMIAVLGVVIVRQLQGSSPGDLIPVTPVTASPQTVTLGEVTPLPNTTISVPTVTVPPAEPETPIELSEAALRGPEPVSSPLEVAAQAEWLVLEFFTLNPSDPWRDRVETASGLRLPPDLAPDTSDGTVVSYVEWTQTRSVEQIGRSTHRATVLMRRLVAVDGAEFRRLPTERVSVILHMDPDGRIRAASLPEVETPPTGDLVPLAGEDLRWTFDEAGIGWPSSRPGTPANAPYDLHR